MDYGALRHQGQVQSAARSACTSAPRSRADSPTRRLLAEFEKTGKFPGGEHAFPPITATRVALNYIAFLTGAAVVAAGCWFGILLARAKMPF